MSLAVASASAPGIKQVASIAVRHAAAVDREGRFPAEAIAALRASGVLGALVPEAEGGQGLSLRAVAEIAMELAQACASTAMIFAMHQIQVACLVNHAGESAYLRDLMARVGAGNVLLGSVTSEVGVGGDIRRSICAVARAGDRFSLEKQGSTVSYGAYADGLLVTARADEAAEPNGQVLVAMMGGEYRLERMGGWDAMGMRGTCSEAFRVRASGNADQIFTQGFAEIIAATMLPVSHLLWASVWFGIAQDALIRARGFVRAEMKRRGELPASARLLPDLFGRVQLLHARLLASLERYETTPGGTVASMGLLSDLTLLKNSMSEGCLKVVQHALSLIGFAAYRNDSEWSLGRHLRDINSAPLMVNNSRITETMSNALLLGPLNFGLV